MQSESGVLRYWLGVGAFPLDPPLVNELNVFHVNSPPPRGRSFHDHHAGLSRQEDGGNYAIYYVISEEGFVLHLGRMEVAGRLAALLSDYVIRGPDCYRCRQAGRKSDFVSGSTCTHFICHC